MMMMISFCWRMRPVIVNKIEVQFSLCLFFYLLINNNRTEVYELPASLLAILKRVCKAKLLMKLTFISCKGDQNFRTNQEL